MEQLKQLLDNLELISFQDISEIPEDKQHDVAEQIERLQDMIKSVGIDGINLLGVEYE